MPDLFCVTLLRACAKKKDLNTGLKLHADTLKRGLLGKSSHVANALVNMYAKCGALAKAKAVHDGLLVQDVFSWNALIAGYAQHGWGEKAWSCFEQMQHDGLSPDEVTFTCILKACSNIRAADKGKQIHDEIIRQGLLGKDIVLDTALVDMYAKCGALAKAQEVIEELPKRDVVTWSALIAGYSQQGQGRDALKCFGRMQQEGFSPNAVTYICVLKACGNVGADDKGEQVHDEIVRQGLLGNNIVLGNALVDMYVKCGALAKAKQVLEDLPERDVVTWSALIAGYAEQGQGEDALKCFEQMQGEGLSPNSVTFICILKACGSTRAVYKGEHIHNEITRQGLLENNTVLGNALVDMYAKCGALTKARQVLDELHTRDIVTWNALIAGYTQHGHGEEALNCFELLQHEGLSPDQVTFMYILKACGNTGAVVKGEQLHDEIARQGLLQNNVMLGSALVEMYAKCGALTKAEQVLEELPVQDVLAWNALIAGYTQQGQGQDALNCFERMQWEGLCLDEVTLTFILKACGSVGAVDKGEQVYDEITRQGLLGNNIALSNAVVGMFAKCGALAKARKVLEELPFRDVVLWSSLIAGYAQHEEGEDALNCYEQMRHEGLPPNALIYVCILKACGIVGAADKGEQIHDEIMRQGLLKNDVVLGNALVDMYAKCGALDKAQQVFEDLPIQDVVAWSALIAGYAQQGQGEQALKCFEQMQQEGFFPDEITFTCSLKACGTIGAADKGEKIHDEIARQGLLGNNTVLGNALVDMYIKCGALAKAEQVLKELSLQDVFSWNALIGGYGQQGKGWDALNCFKCLQRKGLCPDAVTFSCVLNACSHSGLVDEGQLYFANMSTKYGITADLEHYTCMVDLFGRAGQFNKAISIIKRMPSSDFPAVWSALLGACRTWGDVNVGRWAFEHSVQVYKSDAAPYICMANIYIAAGMQEDAEKVEAMRWRNKAGRKPGELLDSYE